MTYVIKFSSRRLKTSAHIYKKYWLEEMLSNRIELIANKDFIFKFRAKKWAEKQILKILIDKKEMEIFDGRG